MTHMNNQYNTHLNHSKNGRQSKSCKRDLLQSQSAIFSRIFGLSSWLESIVHVYSTLCLKIDAYLQNVFELNTAEHKLLWFTIPHLEASSGDRNCANMISCKANRHSFHVFLDYHNDWRVSCMFYPTLCLKMSAYFNDIFELNTAKHKLLQFAIPH